MGVGVFLVMAMLRILFDHPAVRTAGRVFTPSCSCWPSLYRTDFWAVAFDSGGVTTGPMTVPFIMALGVGVASIRSDRNAGSDSFGLVALCSIGPILAVLLLGLLYQPDGSGATPR